MPETWEDRLVIYITSLVQLGHESQTMTSYISAFITVLKKEHVVLKDDTYTLSSLVKACKIKTGVFKVRLPIQRGLLRIILDKMDEYYQLHSQPYLCCLYKAITAITYYGWLRIGEVTTGEHPIIVRDVFMAKKR